MSAADLTPSDLTPSEAARWAARSGLPLAEDRHTEVATTAGHIHSVVSLLRELDFGDTPPSAAYRAGGEQHDAAL
ncbi:amidase [Streptomyces eurocidicus]|uniref:2-hydroxychromene-2-carboxylate isomerase n=1 Tax=Streptomyces eurocidicus TaxID=66423 RepID=A0A2N8NTV1_STREU|nr:hypothetical protein [Streptomyces eurocidicus]MBB5119373.1 2-hydroxychromene-2-carboxylate isomerase [Streptomyces eurocidicus]MBF6053048.1 hypothetical protein [Streptomyces eurocidicus]PNE32172.1 amidase [Streptomyces eurocidicus]